MLHRLCGSPSIPLSFSLATVFPGGVLIALAALLEGSIPQTAGTHRLQRGLPGYLILFAPHAFAPQRQIWPQQAAFAAGVPPDIYEFHLYTRNSTCL